MSDPKILFQAIALRKCVHANYNKGDVRIAPHIMYTKHDEIYVDGVTIERDGRPPRERKLGSFKLTGLKELAIDPTDFEPEPEFDPANERYSGVTLFAVEA